LYLAANKGDAISVGGTLFCIPAKCGGTEKGNNQGIAKRTRLVALYTKWTKGKSLVSGYYHHQRNFIILLLMRKIITILSLCMLSAISTHAQKDDTLEIKKLYVNGFFQPCDSAKHVYKRVAMRFANDAVTKDYDKKGQLVQETHYAKDDKNGIRNGYFCFYDQGIKLYEGHYQNNKPVGTWYFYRSGGMLADSLEYQPVDQNAALKKQGITLKDHITPDNPDNSQIFLNVEKEAAFAGEQAAWRKYLERKLHLPDIVIETTEPGIGKVVVQFIVCRDGSVCDLQLMESYHPLLDWEAVKAIRKSPRWTPAEQNGRTVKSYHRQPISFVISE
jgi:Gram-negative bacterial TonB protein C-terminal